MMRTMTRMRMKSKRMNRTRDKWMKHAKQEKGSEYILAHTGLRELDGHPLRGCGSGFGLVPGYTTLSVRVRANT